MYLTERDTTAPPLVIRARLCGTSSKTFWPIFLYGFRQRRPGSEAFAFVECDYERLNLPHVFVDHVYSLRRHRKVLARIFAHVDRPTRQASERRRIFD